MPAPADQILQQSLAAHRRGALAEAAPLYRRVLEIDPANEVACTNLAAIAAQAGNLAKAENLYRRVATFKPDARRRRITISASSSRSRAGSIWRRSKSIGARSPCVPISSKRLHQSRRRVGGTRQARRSGRGISAGDRRNATAHRRVFQSRRGAARLQGHCRTRPPMPLSPRHRARSEPRRRAQQSGADLERGGRAFRRRTGCSSSWSRANPIMPKVTTISARSCSIRAARRRRSMPCSKPCGSSPIIPKPI